MKRTPGLTKEKDSGFGHYTVPRATPRPNYTKYPLRSLVFGRLFISGSHGKCQSSGQGLRIGQGIGPMGGRRSSEILTGPRRERQKLKRQQQNGEAPAMDLSRPAMMEQSNTDSWQVGGRFSRGFQSEPCRSELNHQCLRKNMENIGKDMKTQ